MSRLAAIVIAAPRRLLVAAGVLLIVAGVFGIPLINTLQTSLSDFEDPGSQTAHAARLIERATGAQDEVGLTALIHDSASPVKSKQARETESKVAKLIAAQPGFRGAIDYAGTHDAELLSRNGRESVVLATFATRKLSYRAAEHLRAKLRAEHAAFGGLDIVFEELTRRSRSDLALAELLVLPLLIALSLWVFRGVIAALLPLIVGVASILLTFLCLQVVQQAWDLSVFALNLVSALGLGLSIDYSLFVLSRYREELAEGESGSAPTGSAAAIRRTLATAGRTVLFSSITVAAAMASLLVFPLRFLYSMGVAGIFTALLAGAIAISVLPAILLLLGDRLDAFTPSWLARHSTPGKQAAAGDWWGALAQRLMRRPGAVALISGAVLLAAGSPVLKMGLTPASASLLPSSSQARQVEQRIERNFATNPALPIATVLVAATSELPQVFEFARQVASASGEPEHVHMLYLKHNTYLIAVAPRGDPFSQANERLVKRLRALRSSYPSAVGGITAWFMDELSSLGSNLPLAILIVALTMFTTIFLMTGSVILPIKTMLMNILTLSVATGALVLGFQEGALSGLFSFSGNGGLEPSNLVLLFTVAFALASDYGVFLLARIKEAHDRGLSNHDAIVLGMQRTGRLITAAALLFCVAVGALVTSSILSVKELGFGAAFAVLVDASIVRALLVPSLMALLGDWNWWSPRPLRRLHDRIGLREHSHSLRGEQAATGSSGSPD